MTPLQAPAAADIENLSIPVQPDLQFPRWTAEDCLGPCADCGDPIERGQICGAWAAARYHDDCLERLGH